MTRGKWLGVQFYRIGVFSWYNQNRVRCGTTAVLNRPCWARDVSSYYGINLKTLWMNVASGLIWADFDYGTHPPCMEDVDFKIWWYHSDGVDKDFLFSGRADAIGLLEESSRCLTHQKCLDLLLSDRVGCNITEIAFWWAKVFVTRRRKRHFRGFTSGTSPEEKSAFRACVQWNRRIQPYVNF